MAVKLIYLYLAVIVSCSGTGAIIFNENGFCEQKESECILDNNTLICSNGLHDPYNLGRSDINNIILCNWNYESLDLSYILELFTEVEKIKIERSFVSYIYSRYSNRRSRIKDLNISDIHLKNFSLENIPSIVTLDISNNLITDITKIKFLEDSAVKNLYISGNPINCSSNMQWLLDSNKVNVVDEKDTLCSNDEYRNKPILGIMNLFKQMEEDCPKMCKCSLDKVVGDLVPIIMVNCNDLGLTQFPSNIPFNTTVVTLKRNKITSVLPLVSNKQYWKVKDLFLDYNLINTIDELEGSYWLSNFRLLSLQGNYISQVQTYSLDNAFERNHYLVRVYFGFNPWRCDCAFTPGFRELLLKYQQYLKDISDIRCAFQDGYENSMLPIAELPIKAFCIDHSLPLHPLDYLSIVFASLTLLILGKLSYDCWYFRRTGKVPWIVANMP